MLAKPECKVHGPSPPPHTFVPGAVSETRHYSTVSSMSLPLALSQPCFCLEMPSPGPWQKSRDDLAGACAERVLC